MHNEIIIYKNGELELPVEVTPDKETVWLNRNQLAVLFDRDVKTIGKHINNALKEELDSSVVAKFATTASDGKTYKVEYYNLDMIISVGYRVKSTRGVEFRRWANKILKDYIVQGYAINERRLAALNRVVEIQSNIIAGVLDLDAEKVLGVVKKYSLALEMLDDYDHQTITKPKISSDEVYKLTYEECRNLISKMSYSETSDIFGKEKGKGLLKGIIDSIYQSAFGEEAYPSIEEKAANLLYFIIKDHPFVDGCKRIAATTFLYFLDMNQILYKNNKKILSDSTLVALTLLIAESKPQEKEIMINIVMNFLTW
ncbi:Fic/DOC domain protein [Fusobacterium necrophorum subsp. funduliforme ATCC 51357]|uniref:Phosphoribosylaminoimidazolesuccinocarboxamide synthase n=2 Tax=Fusobacterium necrophorum TaxID=859 RepID=A0A162II36_9FUSO|nr:RhuM family protein [Fusobacterium necrophorum]AYV93319.1 phosphoribosylaminoimidazolesuccinocarboxamide synthase [Fusobacterium necrophorum subsp. funduliforme]EIJ68412.1 Fic/DOC domain protein [Fusobacterium necrophorum subsp. funduliforme ATCC 51357]KAB0554460.1 phosphoribosylaminoimidazolesuccinocarboxamide synthase [Fusobacterium necrophorum subsp. funduliforme]KYL00776.1 phosphoribosylaminoimidazolesuccinocarboxamide synthase [Fusobacterium necrophorum subsp. funduliforme]KYM46790.1 p